MSIGKPPQILKPWQFRCCCFLACQQKCTYRPTSRTLPLADAPAGLLKLVFATETLAAGINMPARTTLIAALSRRRDSGIGSLYHNELLQMAGRAGRRGYDTVGNCVILQVYKHS
jgi:replicative superfamily II helicase